MKKLSFKKQEAPHYLQHEADACGEVHIQLEPSACLQYINFQALDQASGQSQTLEQNNTLKKINLHLQKDSRAQVYLLNLQGQNIELNLYLEKAGAEVQLRILSLLQGQQTSQIQVTLHHKVSHTSSHLLAKSVLSNSARHIFNCRQLLDRKAQLTCSQQKSQHLLLSPQARAQTAPQLEVQADDVTATHGATVGPLDKEALFYLNTRSISNQQARQLLTQAFIQNVCPPQASHLMAQAIATYFAQHV